MNKTSEAPSGGDTVNPAVKDAPTTTAASENGALARSSHDDPGVWRGRYEELKQSYELGMPMINKELDVLRKRTAELESALKSSVDAAPKVGVIPGITGGATTGVKVSAIPGVVEGATPGVNVFPGLQHAQTGGAAVLEKLVSPAHSSTPAASAAADTEVFTREDIRAFYNSLARGKYKGSAQETLEIEKRIAKAVKDGRVTGR